MPLDLSSDAVQRDPNKCVLCGDCVRVCSEIQSVGALDFAFRGADARVLPCFNKGLGEIECVGCGQCVKVCPVGALTPRSQVESVWRALHDPEKTVVVSIAPAVRVAVGEAFGFAPGETTSGQIVASLRLMGFDRVYDTSFAADMTVLEEANEFLERYQQGRRLPQFTSCCPAWVKFAEQYYPEMLENLSTCKSPQQMLGSAVKAVLTKELNKPREQIINVSIMPCTAKKFVARRPEMAVDGNPDVDFVLTSQEFILMAQESGIEFERLDPESFDMPFGFKTGAGVIFGASGGVSEAVLRYAAGKLGAPGDFRDLRGEDGIRTGEVTVGDVTLRLAVVSGLSNARRLMDQIRSGEAHYDLIEVMACCGGCVNGGGQPVHARREDLKKRTKGLFDNDKMLQFHRSQDNPYLRKLYDEHLTGHRAHDLLHTRYKNRKRIENEDIRLSEGAEKAPALEVTICFGTSCFLRGAQKLYAALTEHVAQNGLNAQVGFKATFCQENCQKGPVVMVGDAMITHCTLGKAVEEINQQLAK
jgi:NADH-quinone oxidoreductase subunit G